MSETKHKIDIIALDKGLIESLIKGVAVDRVQVAMNEAASDPSGITRSISNQDTLEKGFDNLVEGQEETSLEEALRYVGLLADDANLLAYEDTSKWHPLDDQTYVVTGKVTTDKGSKNIVQKAMVPPPVGKITPDMRGDIILGRKGFLASNGVHIPQTFGTTFRGSFFEEDIADKLIKGRDIDKGLLSESVLHDIGEMAAVLDFQGFQPVGSFLSKVSVGDDHAYLTDIGSDLGGVTNDKSTRSLESLQQYIDGDVALPAYKAKQQELEDQNIEYSLVIIKPGFAEHQASINAMLAEDGLKVVASEEVRMHPTQAAGFYAEHKEKPHFPEVVKYITSGPVIVQVISGVDAIQKSRDKIGKTNPGKAAEGTIRNRFGEDGNYIANVIHGSDSPESARREIAFARGILGVDIPSMATRKPVRKGHLSVVPGR